MRRALRPVDVTARPGPASIPRIYPPAARALPRCFQDAQHGLLIRGPGHLWRRRRKPPSSAGAMVYFTGLP